MDEDSWRELLPLLLLYSSAANALGVVDTAQSQASDRLPG